MQRFCDIAENWSVSPYYGRKYPLLRTPLRKTDCVWTWSMPFGMGKFPEVTLFSVKRRRKRLLLHGSRS